MIRGANRGSLRPAAEHHAQALLARTLDAPRHRFPTTAAPHRLGPGLYVVPMAEGARAPVSLAPAVPARTYADSGFRPSLTPVDRGTLTRRQIDDVSACTAALPFTPVEAEPLVQLGADPAGITVLS
ncbi:hypothetical protein OK074_2058 [Actinobacteria bacterium OK074]|nr:hypothetical protein OK074_2058 [Actinobacteria bacterium OK074]